MKTRKKLQALLMVVIFTVTSMPISGKAATSKQAGNSYCKYVFDGALEIEQYLRQEYSNVWSIKLVSDKKLDSKNHAQSTLNINYNYNKGTYDPEIVNSKGEYYGTCWAVSTATMVDYYNTTNKNIDDIYAYTIKNAVKKGYVFPALGLPGRNQDKLLNYVANSVYVLTEYNKTTYGNNIYSRLVNEIDDGRLTLFSLPTHEMVGCGYATWEVSYGLNVGCGKLQTINKKIDFVIVNSTWSDNIQYSYYPAGKIVNGAKKSYEFCITVLEEK